VSAAPQELAAGLHRWSTRHPDWHPADAFGAEVASFALVADDDLLLVDPLLPDDDGAVLEALDALAAAAHQTHVLITIGYHVRSAEPLSKRYNNAEIHGPRTVASRLSDPKRFTELTPGTEGPAGVVAHAIGRPRRSELPLWIPSHHALVFGDALVTTPDGELRMWSQEEVDDRRRAFYRDRFAPTLGPLRDLAVKRVLVTHGPPVLDDAAAALAAAIDGEPWHHHG
jgi:hypothetical protein